MSADVWLDGNGVAGLLAEALGADVTAVERRCHSCNEQHPVGAHRAWRGAGLVLRCSSLSTFMSSHTPDTAPARDVLYSADTLSAAELDALPYGMIQLDSRGSILRYSSAETRLSGLTADECVGRSFFDEIAPCTHVQEFYGRFLRGVQEQQLDAVFTFRFAFVPPKDVRVHLFTLTVTAPLWLLLLVMVAVGVLVGVVLQYRRR